MSVKIFRSMIATPRRLPPEERGPVEECRANFPGGSLGASGFSVDWISK